MGQRLRRLRDAREGVQREKQRAYLEYRFDRVFDGSDLDGLLRSMSAHDKSLALNGLLGTRSQTCCKRQHGMSKLEPREFIQQERFGGDMKEVVTDTVEGFTPTDQAMKPRATIKWFDRAHTTRKDEQVSKARYTTP